VKTEFDQVISEGLDKQQVIIQQNFNKLKSTDVAILCTYLKSLDLDFYSLSSKGNIACSRSSKGFDAFEFKKEFQLTHFTIRIAQQNDYYLNSINSLDQKALFFILPIFIFIYIILLYFGINLSKPLRILLAQTTHLERKIPVKKRLKLLYTNDEWDNIFHTINMAQQNMEQQLKIIKEEDKKNKILLESITDGIVAVDLEHKILFYNSRFSSKFIRKENQTSLYLKDVIKNEEILAAFKDCMDQARSITIKEFSFNHKNRTLFFEIKINPLIYDKGRIKGAVAAFHNVTETKLTEQMRVDFVANVSHEIRTPLTSILGFAQVLEATKQNLDKKYHHYISRIIENSERLHSLFTDLLDLSVIESKHKLKKEKVHLKTLIHNIKASIEAKYPQKDLLIHFDIEEKIIKVDPKLMEQVFTNLIDNACKYSEDNNVKIKISNITDGENIIISVSDKGPGISQEHLSRIFERFYRVDESRTTIKGSGVGLSIVKHIINKHKGKIWVESVPNHGTSFYIKLPHQKYFNPKYIPTHSDTEYSDNLLN
jgi:two-component system phosphate regulon sensor histidine kinase PhoR